MLNLLYWWYKKQVGKSVDTVKAGSRISVSPEGNAGSNQIHQSLN